jgi:hypothetical protein
MTGFAKTSGGRGVHLAVPIAPEWDFIQVRRAVRAERGGREGFPSRPDVPTREQADSDATAARWDTAPCPHDYQPGVEKSWICDSPARRARRRQRALGLMVRATRI